MIAVLPVASPCTDLVDTIAIEIDAILGLVCDSDGDRLYGMTFGIDGDDRTSGILGLLRRHPPRSQPE